MEHKSSRCAVCNDANTVEYGVITPEGTRYTMWLCNECAEQYRAVNYYLKPMVRES